MHNDYQSDRQFVEETRALVKGWEQTATPICTTPIYQIINRLLEMVEDLPASLASETSAMIDREVKQVIVMRDKYPDGKGGVTSVRKGKLIAQGSHASMAFITRQIQSQFPPEKLESMDYMLEKWQSFPVTVTMLRVWLLWMAQSFVKVVLKVNDLDELMQIKQKAEESGLEVHLIVDSGKTEFRGEPTPTCLAIGPDYADRIDPITSHLPLY